MNSKLRRILLLGLPILGIFAGYVLMARPVTLTIDGTDETVTTRALTVRGVLRSAGIHIAADDTVSPSAGTWLTNTTDIVFNHAGLISVWVDPQGENIKVNTILRTPIEIVRAAGLAPKTGDVYRINGLVVDANQEVSPAKGFVLQFTPCMNITLFSDGKIHALCTTAGSVGTALWQEGVELHSGDLVVPALNSPITDNLEVTVTRGTSLVINVDGKTLEISSAAPTVGQALQQNGVALQDLDYSKPTETVPLPEDGKIEVIRVTEEILVEQSAIPYTVEYVGDDQLELDQHSVKVEGEYGLQAARVRVRYENGVEVSRINEGTVVLKQPVNRQEAYGSKIVLKTIDTPDGPITYYRAITVTATSYSPCNSGVGECLYGTALGLPVQKGVIAVHLAWYRFLKGTKMYVPGYGIGTIADTGSYPYNSNWIDLGFTDAEFALYGKFYPSITVYLMAPAPPNVPGIMP